LSHQVTSTNGCSACEGREFSPDYDLDPLDVGAKTGFRFVWAIAPANKTQAVLKPRFMDLEVVQITPGVED
jgi:hypothetical protein